MTTAPLTKADLISGERFLELAQRNSAHIAYMKMDTLKSGSSINWRGQVNSIRSAPCWISGHGAVPLTSTMYESYKTLYKVWFSTNAIHEHPSIYQIPLGLPNYCNDSALHLIYGNQDILLEVLQETPKPAEEKGLVFMNFVINTNSAVRQRVWDMFKDKPWVLTAPNVVTLEGRKAFLREIRNHKFVLCPRGYGVDTHRLWETLYLGSIPIVVRDPAMRDFVDLPIAWIDDWTEVTPEWLESEYARITASAPPFPHEKLRMSYWENKILSAAASALTSTA